MVGSSVSKAQQDALLEAYAKYTFGDLGKSFGPFVLGWAFDFIMCGLVCHQLITWLGGAHQERTFTKFVTAWVCSLAVAGTVYGIWFMWFMFVRNFGTYATLTRLDLVAFYGLIDVLVAFPVQLFYLERAYRLLHKQLWVLLCIAPLCLAAFISGLGTFATTVSLDNIANLPKYRGYYFTFFATIMAGDILLTCTITWGLWRSRTGWSNTDKLVTRLIRATVETQLPCTLTAMANLLCYAGWTNSTMNGFWSVILSKVYAISYMAVLNYRYVLRRDGASSGSSMFANDNTFGYPSDRLHQRTINLDHIRIDTTVVQKIDQSPPPRVGINRQKPTEESSTVDGRDADAAYPGTVSRDHLIQV